MRYVLEQLHPDGWLPCRYVGGVKVAVFARREDAEEMTRIRVPSPLRVRETAETDEELLALTPTPS